MDLQSRKIEFIQEFLKIQSEEAISNLEKLLKKEKKSLDKTQYPMTERELNQRIDRSEDDFKNNRYKTNTELLSKYQ